MKIKPAIVALMLACLPGIAHAWSGNTWGNITRATIQANADQMIDFTWTPKNTFTNFQYGSTYRTYYQGTTYSGVAYSQNNPQENYAEFCTLVTNTAGGSVGYGNDCSGFVSVCWRLPNREVTATFESKLGGSAQWTSLGDIGSAATAPLVMGDALNSSSVGHIVLFLNFESTGVRTMEQTPNNAQRKVRTYSSVAEYRPIRRLQITDAPTISADGLSRAMDVGSPMTLRVAASGAGALAYRWHFNASPIAGATTSQLAIPSVQLTNSGNYWCVVTNIHGGTTSRVMSLTVYPPQTTVFLDAFDIDTTADWTVNRSSFDTRATFNYDYSTMGIPPAPRTVGVITRGLRMEANLSAGVTAALSLSPKNQVFAGDYRLRFDMWINANGPFPLGGTGSTEHVTGGLGTTGNRVQWTGSGSTADGYWFSVDGEGQAGDTSTTSGDFCAFLGASLQTPGTGVYAAGTDASAKGNNHSYYVSAFPGGASAPALQQANYPQQTGALAGGAVGFAWREVIIARRGNVVDWVIDGIRLATFTNATFTASNVFVGYWDSYASLSDNPNLSFGLVDNVRVEVPVQSPTITTHPQSQAVMTGDNVTFAVVAAGTGPLNYQWRLNSTNLVGATASSYTCTNVQAGDAGSYGVVVSNMAGTVTSSNAALVVMSPLASLCGAGCLPDGRFRMTLSGGPGRFAIDAATNLAGVPIAWVELTNVMTTTNGLEYTDPQTNLPQRFYRARLLPP